MSEGKKDEVRESMAAQQAEYMESQTPNASQREGATVLVVGMSNGSCWLGRHLKASC